MRTDPSIDARQPRGRNALPPGRSRHTRTLVRMLGAAAVLLASALPTAAQSAISGRVFDPEGQPVAEAVVHAIGPARLPLADTTGAAGSFEISPVPSGTYTLTVSHPAFLPATVTVRIGENDRRQLDIRIRPDTIILDRVVVEGRRGGDRERDRFETEPGVTARVVAGDQIKILPGLAEADVMRAVEVLPGVISTSDFSSAFHVRGGSADQNLILLDGVPVFNPFHLGGLFGVFNADAIARAELFSGGFGAEYGGRVSSVLNIETDPGLLDRVEAHAGISLLASRLLLRGPAPAVLDRLTGLGDTRWMVSARRSYFDQILKPVVNFPYHLTDFQGYLETRLPGGGRLSFTGYSGADVLDLSDFEPPGEERDSSSILRIRWRWGNQAAGIRWQQALGSRWAAETRLGWSSFADRLGFADFGDITFSSNVSQLSLKTRASRSLGSGTTLSIGGGAERLRFHNLAEAGGTSFLDSSGDGVLGSAFASLRWQPTTAWIVEPGLRVDTWTGAGEHTLLSPRFAAKRFLGRERDLALKFSVGRYTQVLHSLRNEELPVSNDTWVLADRGIPAVVSDQAQIGLEKYWGDDWYASFEAYYRTFDGVTEFNLADDPNDPEDDLLVGTGVSRGLDFLVRRERGRLSGWAALSLLDAQRTIPDPLASGWTDLPPTITFSPVYDRAVDLDLVLRYQLPERLELGLRWNYGSPIPYTRPVAQHFGFEYSPLRAQYEPVEQFDGAAVYVVLGQRNRERYPAYHRLDLTLRRSFNRSWGSFTPYLQVLNAYDQRNVLWYFYDYDRVPPTRSGISMFPVLPALGVEASF